MMGHSKVVLKKYTFIEKCNKAEFLVKVITYLCLNTKDEKR
jgi:hypothetical protein